MDYLQSVNICANVSLMQLDTSKTFFYEDMASHEYIDTGASARQNKEECLICLENYKAGVELKRLSCTHVFHKECIEGCSKTKSYPSCHQFHSDKDDEMQLELEERMVDMDLEEEPKLLDLLDEDMDDSIPMDYANMSDYFDSSNSKHLDLSEEDMDVNLANESDSLDTDVLIS